MTDLAERIHQPFYRWHGVCLQVDPGDPRRALRRRRAAGAGGAPASRGCATASTPRTSTSTRSWSRSAGRRARLDEYWPEVAHHGERYLWIPRWRDALAAAERGDRGAAASSSRATPGTGSPTSRGTGSGCCGCAALAEACVLVGDRAAAAAALRAAAAVRGPQRRRPDPAAVRAGGAAPRDARGDARALGRGRGGTSRPRSSAASCSERRAVRARVLLRVRARARRAARRRRARRRAARGGAPPQRGPRPAGHPAARSAAGAGRSPRRASSARASSGRSPTRERRCGCATSRACATSPPCSPRPGCDIHVLELVAAATAAQRTRRGTASTAAADASTRCSTLRPRRSTAPGSRTCAPSSRRRAASPTTSGPPRLEEEIDALVERARAAPRAWAAATGPSSSPAERARVNVTKAIRTAIKLIERESPALAEHLSAADPHRPLLLVRAARRGAAALARSTAQLFRPDSRLIGRGPLPRRRA